MATDPTSFASILAGVQRMRQELGGNNESADSQPDVVQNIPSSSEQTHADSKSQSKPTNHDQSQSKPTQHDQSQSKPTTKHDESRSSTINNNPPSAPNTGTTKPGPTNLRNRALIDQPSTNQNATTNKSDTPTSFRPRTTNYSQPNVLVHPSQTGNPLLKDSLMKTTPFSYDSTILSDYYINPKFQILFLSLKYHKLRPEYIWSRLSKLKGSIVEYDDVLRVLLVVVDIESHQDILRSLSNLCLKQGLALVLAWSFEEAGNYVHFAKTLDGNPQLLEQNLGGVKPNMDYKAAVTETLTNVRSVNKTDVSNLLANYKSFKGIVLGNVDGDSSKITGLGATKLENLRRAFEEPFIYNKE